MSGLDVHGTETEVCPSCRERTNFVEEWRSGDLVCSSCGFCFPERLVDPGEEKRKFSDSSDDPHRSARVDPYLEMLPGTIIAREVVTVGGNITHTNHLGKRQAAMVSRHDRSLVQVFDKINHVCSKLVLPERVRSRAKEIFSKYKNAKAEQGKAIPKAEGLVAAVICLACKEEKLPRTPKELAFDTGVREKTIRKHFRELQELQRKAGGWNKSQAVSTTNPSDLVPRVCTKLRLPFDPVVSAAVAVATKAKDFLEGKHPNSIAAASVFLVCGLLEEFRRSQDDIATAAHISPSTLRSVHRELLQYQHEVLPPQLLPQASSSGTTLQQATPSPAQSGVPSPAGTSPSVSSPSSISSEEDGIAV